MGMRSNIFGRECQSVDGNFGLRDEAHKTASIERTAVEKFDKSVKLLPVDMIIAKDQVRKEFDSEKLNELVVSLRTLGQQTPILVYWSCDDDKYVIIFGERRWRAAPLAGLTHMSCQLHPHKPAEAELVELQFVENAIRADLNPIEEAESYRKLMELKGYSANQLAQRIGKNQTTISRTLRLLRLPQAIQGNVAKGDIPASVALEITKLDNEEAQRVMVETYLRGELTTSQAQEHAKEKSDAKRASSDMHKRWTKNRITICVTYPRGTTLAEVADVLEDRVAQLRNDGRSKRAA